MTIHECVNANMEEEVASCIIHFGDVSSRIFRQYTAVSLSKFIHCGKIWLSLTGAQSEVDAVRSLEHFTDLDEETFSNEGTIPERSLQYRVECCRKFTDKPKLKEHNVQLQLYPVTKPLNQQEKGNKEDAEGHRRNYMKSHIIEYFCEEVTKKKLIINKEIMFMSTLSKAFVKVVADIEGFDASN